MIRNEILLDVKIMLKFNDDISMFFLTNDERQSLKDAYKSKDIETLTILHKKHKREWDDVIDDLTSPLIVCDTQSLYNKQNKVSWIYHFDENRYERIS